MASEDFIALNQANWNERAPEHAKSKDYAFDCFINDPTYLSEAARFDLPLLPDVTGLDIVHLQCHIAADTLSLARRGAKTVSGLDFSAVSIQEARRLALLAAGGEKLSFVEGTVYNAPRLLGAGSFDMVFTGIGAICWIPNIRLWAGVVSDLLKSGGRLFLRDFHPILHTIDDSVSDHLAVQFPYFEREEPMIWDDGGTYVELEEGTQAFKATKTAEWNHGLGEIIQALLDVGMVITGLTEHKSAPFNAFQGKMEYVGGGEWELKEGKDKMPLSFTLQARKK